MPGSTVYQDADAYDDGTRYEMVAHSVPSSSDYPDGVKYRFQYMDTDGTTLLRFDNFPNHSGVDRHHYHTPDGAFDDIEYEGLTAHIQKFYDGIDTVRTTGEYP
jgi:hypothetical protein